MMKKNFIYSLCILLCGTIFMSSCEDMLEVDSDRVEYDMSTLTFNDTVYSVLGILKQVQAVGDRQVLLGELRGDLMTVNKAKAVTDIQEISRFEFDGDNEYLAVKDYYAIINNCNIYLARVDTTLNRDGKFLMVPEYVAVKSARAWTYMQLAMNYGQIPYFTEPILTNSFAEEVMKKDFVGIEELASYLIEDLLPYANPKNHPMPSWSGLSVNGSSVPTKYFFMPIRQLLGDLYLWSGKYKEAAESYFTIIKENYYTDNADANVWMDEKAEILPLIGHDASYSNISTYNTTAVIGYESSTSTGSVSNLADIIAPVSAGENMVAASPGYYGLSKNQVYLYREDAVRNPATAYNPSKDMPGDLRLYSSVFTQRDMENTYSGIIGKFNSMGYVGTYNNMPMTSFQSQCRFIKIGRPIQLYLRLAEALVGLEATDSKWEGALELAMTILKSGAKEEIYNVRKYLETIQEPAKIVKTDEEGNIVYLEDGVTPDSIEILVNKDIYDTIEFDFSSEMFDNTIGIHSRGSGQTEYNEYYSLADSIIGDYLSITPIKKDVVDEEGNIVTDEEGNAITVADYQLTSADSVKYMRELIIDECALETAFEGYRFTDLIRFAKAMGDNDVLAKRVAGREVENSVNYYHAEEYSYDDALYQILKNEGNWYLPLK